MPTPSPLSLVPRPLSATAILDGYRSAQLSPVTVAEGILALDLSGLNPFAATIPSNDFLAAATAAAARWKAGTPLGPLDGLPVTVKDFYDVAGLPTRYGSRLSSEAPATADAPLVRRLRAAGAIVFAKTTLPEFGHKGSTHSPLYGVTRNPYDPDLTCGGSSGGAAVAAAIGAGALHVGSDAGGSIRIPASFCNVFGFKPTPGSVPHDQPSFFDGMASAGAMTRDVADAALMLDVISAKTYSGYREAAVTPLARRLRVACAATVNDTPVDPRIAGMVAEAVSKIHAIADIVDIALDIPQLVDTFNTHWVAAAAYHVAQVPESKRVLFDPYYLEWAAKGAAVGRDDLLAAGLERQKIRAAMATLFEAVDILVMPVTPVMPFPAGDNTPRHADGTPYVDWSPLTYPANLAGLPAASIPCGFADGLPVGLQVIAAAGNDHMLMQACAAIEAVLGLNNQNNNTGG